MSGDAKGRHPHTFVTLVLHTGTHVVIADPLALALNVGSSSIKFALYQLGRPPKRGLHGKVDRIGLGGTELAFDDPSRNEHGRRGLGDLDHRST